MTALSIEQIKGYLPHRYPFLLVDAVDEIVKGESIIARKAVSVNEPLFNGHFPGNPVFPGVLQIEAMGQAGVLLAIISGAEVDDEHTLYVSSISDCRFKLPVVPGDMMELRAKVIRYRLSTWKLGCEIRVKDKRVSTATVTVTVGPRATPNALPDDFPKPIYGPKP